MNRKTLGWLLVAGLLAAFATEARTGEDRKTQDRKAEQKTEGRGEKGEAKALPLDEQFLIKAYVGNHKEVTLGQLAVKQAKHEKVREFGEHMVKDHGKSNEKVMALLRQRNAPPPPTEAKQKIEMAQQKLAKLQGEEFDKAYMQMMVEGHIQAEAMYKNQIQNGKEQEIVTFAKEGLPTVQQHVQKAREIAGVVGANAAPRDGGTRERENK